MLQNNILRKICLGTVALFALHCTAMAGEVVVEDGTVERKDNEPTYSGGKYTFDFTYHPIANEADRDNLLLGVPSEPVSLDPIELLRKYPGREILDTPEMSALMRQSAAGGVAAAFSDMVIEDIAVLQVNCIAKGAPIDEVEIEPVYSNIRIHTNPIRGNAVFNVFSYKKILCPVGDEIEEIPLKRRWVIVARHGLEQRDISKTITFTDSDGNAVTRDMTYMMSASGKPLRLLAYYSNLTLTGERYQTNMRLVSAFDPFGNVDPRNKYYLPNRDSCIDIVFHTRPPNGQKIWSDPTDMRFCARGCIPGDVSATK